MIPDYPLDYTFIADEVVVRATRAGKNAPLAFENISKEEIQNQNMGQDVAYISIGI